jgi:hypothetical protein
MVFIKHVALSCFYIQKTADQINTNVHTSLRRAQRTSSRCILTSNVRFIAHQAAFLTGGKLLIA